MQNSKLQFKIKTLASEKLFLVSPKNFEFLIAAFNFSRLTFNFRRRQSGFTLIEILVTVALVGIITVIGMRAISAMLGSYGKSRVINTLQSEGARGMAEMTRVIRASTSARTGDGNPSDDELVLTIDENSIEWDATDQCREIRFRLETSATGNGYIQRQDNLCDSGGGSFALTNDAAPTGVDVSTLTFTVSSAAGSPDRVNIDLVLRQSVGLPSSDPAYATSVSLQRVVSTRSY